MPPLPELHWPDDGVGPYHSSRLLLQDATAAVDTCALPCGTATCGYFNTSFQCWELEALSCPCTGCCREGQRPLAGAEISVIFMACIWLLSFSLYQIYRRLAFIDVRQKLGDVKPPPRNSDFEDELTDEQLFALRRRRRYEFSLLNCLLPFVSFCCPLLHRYFSEIIGACFDDVANAWRKVIGCWRKVIGCCRNSRENVKYAVQKLIVVCKLVGTAFMISDIFTKATDEKTFKKMRAHLRNIPEEGEDTRFARIGRMLTNAVSR